MVGLFLAHPVEIRGAKMKIRLHGGSTFTVPHIEGVKKSTQLMVQKQFGSRTVDKVWTLEEYNKQFIEKETEFEFDEEPSSEESNDHGDILPSW